MRIAVPTRAYAGLEDSVSEVFGKTKTFTIVDVEAVMFRSSPRRGCYQYGGVSRILR